MNKELFNQWADSYDESIKESERTKTYPFYGYQMIQTYIYDEASKKNHARILEMGIGTGMMTKRLYDDGFDITGVDFSKNMLEKAKTIMPNNKYIQNDFLNVLNDLKNEIFDVIIFSYSIHHLTREEQVKLLGELTNNLASNGVVIIGDVITETKEEMDRLAKENDDIWDYDEFYPIYELVNHSDLKELYRVDYQQFTYCSGIIRFSKL